MNKTTNLNQPHIVHSDIQPLIDALRSNDQVRVREVGRSFEQRSIHLLSLGHGPIVIFAWTQMHGNEATATASVFDLIEQLTSQQSLLPKQLQSNWEQQFTLHILPMLNPDGAERCIRQNAQGIDINRDANSQQTPEGRLLMSLADELKPNIGFNLHDQSPYYQCGTSGNPATIAFLAPAYDVEKTIDESRQLAMQIIVKMNKKLQASIPDCIARYDDTFSPRSFGDIIAGKQVSTILIESGAAVNDPNRQIARKLNVTAILTAMDYLSVEQQSDANKDIADYFAIPENISEVLSSIVLRELSFAPNSPHAYTAGVSIKQTARYSNDFRVDYIGDLGIQAGLQELDASSFHYRQGKCFDVSALTNTQSATTADYGDLLRDGYICFYAPTEADKERLSNPHNYPVHWVDTPELVLGTPEALILQQAAYFLLCQHSTADDKNEHPVTAAILNGRYVKLA